MKKNLKNTYLFALKGYDRVRAIYKLRKSINKFGDKLGKKQHILNIILKNNIINDKFIDLNITKFYPGTKPINFKNFLIKHSNNIQYSEEIKNSNNCTDEIATTNQTNEIISSKIFMNKNNLNKNEKLDNASKEKIISYNSKTKENKTNSFFNKVNKKNLVKKISVEYKNDTKIFDIFNPPQKYRKSSMCFSSSNSDIHSNIISSRNNNKDIITIKKYNNKPKKNYQKTNSNNNNFNMSLYNKNIIPKIKILKLSTNKNLNNSQKSYSTSNISKIHMKSRNIANKIYSNNSQRKIILSKNISLPDESNINNINLTKDNEEIINEKFISKGMNTLMTKTFNFYKRSKIPSYIRLPKINKISFPKEIIGPTYKINNGTLDQYYIVKDEQKQIINKIQIAPIDNLKSLM